MSSAKENKLCPKPLKKSNSGTKHETVTTVLLTLFRKFYLISRYYYTFLILLDYNQLRFDTLLQVVMHPYYRNLLMNAQKRNRPKSAFAMNQLIMTHLSSDSVLIVLVSHAMRTLNKK